MQYTAILWVIGWLWTGFAIAQNVSQPDQVHLLAHTPTTHDHIRLYEVETGREHTLRMGDGWHHVWGFSPDGCQILYTLTGSTGLARAYIANLDGSNARELVRYDALPESGWGVWEPSWSPDGERIAFKLIRDGLDGAPERQYHVAWVSAEGGEPTFYSITGREHTPHWSPDGAWLTYLSFTPVTFDNDTIVNEAALWVVSADGGTKYRLTNFISGSVDKPRWSPDGEWIAFVYSPSPGNNTLWMIRNQANAEPVEVASQWQLTLDFVWMNNQSALLGAIRDFRGVPRNMLWTIPLDGTANDRATITLTDDAFTYADFPRWSNDGRWLALRSHYGLVIADAENGTLWAEVEGAEGNSAPVWSPVTYPADDAFPSCNQ